MKVELKTANLDYLIAIILFYAMLKVLKILFETEY